MKLTVQMSMECRHFCDVQYLVSVYLGTSKPTVGVHRPITGQRREDVSDPDGSESQKACLRILRRTVHPQPHVQPARVEDRQEREDGAV